MVAPSRGMGHKWLLLGGLELLVSPSGGTVSVAFGWGIKAISSWWDIWSTTNSSGVAQRKAIASSPGKCNSDGSFHRGNEQMDSSFCCGCGAWNGSSFLLGGCCVGVFLEGSIAAAAPSLRKHSSNDSL